MTLPTRAEVICHRNDVADALSKLKVLKADAHIKRSLDLLEEVKKELDAFIDSVTPQQQGFFGSP
jgi:hypothetical protein